MKIFGAILVALLALASPALAQNPQTVKLCIPTSTTTCPAVTASNPLPITGSFSATLAGFTPNGNYGTLTATAATSASTSLPAGTVVAFQNLSAIDVSCVLTAGASTATTNKLIVRAGATVYYTVGSNTTTACINQTGSASNVVGLAGGAGLGTAFGGASAGGGGGGAVTLASGAVASGAYSSGSIASGAYASGSVSSGAYASGAVVDITNLSTPVAANTATATKGILLGGQFDTTQKTLTNGQQAALSVSNRGALFVESGVNNLIVVGAGTAGSASGGVLTVQGSASGTAIPVTLTSTTVTGTVAVTQSGAWSLSANQSVNIAQINGVTPLMGNGVTGTGSQRVTIASDNTAFAVNATLQASSATAIGTVNPTTAANWGIGTSTQNSASVANGTLILGQFNTTPTTITTGNMSPFQMDNAGNLLVNVKVGGGTGGTSSTFGAAFPGTGTAVGMTQGGNMVALSGTGGSLNVNITGGAGSGGTASADGVTFVAGTTQMTPAGCFFQTTATSNPLTTGLGGWIQCTAQRAAFTNLRNASGTEIGTSAAELFVGGRGTAGSAAGGVLTIQGVASMTKLLVTPDSVALPANQSVNVSQINAVTPLMGNGVTGTGSQRVTIASDNTAFSVNATLSAETTKVIGTTRTVGSVGGVLDAIGQNVAAPANWLQAGCQFQTTPTTITATNGSPCQMDNAGNILVNVKSATGLAQGSTTSGQSGSLVMGAVTTASPSYTTAQTSPLSLDTAGSLRVAIVSGAGSGGTAIADGATFTEATTSFTPVGGEYVSGGGANCTTGKGCTWQMTIDRMGYVNVGKINGVTPLMGNGTTGTGSQRVTLASDGTAISTAGFMSVKIDQTTPGTTNLVSIGTNGTVNPQTAANWAIGATGSAVPANAQLTGGTDGTNTRAIATDSSGNVKTINGGSNYETVAASQTAQALGATGATGDYLSHCVIYPVTTAAGAVTVFDNTNAAASNVITFTSGTLSNLAPIALPVGAVSTGGSWKVTTGANVTVTCYGKFT